jgi:hypothetical protein
MVPQKIIFALCCVVGVTLPLAVSAQLTKTPPTGGMTPSAADATPSVPGGVTPPSVPGGLSTPRAQDLAVPGTGGGTVPSPSPSSTDVPAPSASPSPSPSPSPSATPTPASGTTPKKSGKSTTVKVNVNTSTLQELTKVKGIGVPTAKKIIMYRPYASMEELVTKKALTNKQMTDLKAQLSL